MNTCVGGILALLHNSGLPSRYRSDRNEFYKLEEHLKSIVDTALVPADQDINEVLADCYTMFRDARQTVQDVTLKMIKHTRGSSRKLLG